MTQVAAGGVNRSCDSCLRVRRNLFLESVHVDNHPGELGGGEGVRLAAGHHHHLLAERPTSAWGVIQPSIRQVRFDAMC
jgi:hypothetical protein